MLVICEDFVISTVFWLSPVLSHNSIKDLNVIITERSGIFKRLADLEEDNY